MLFNEFDDHCDFYPNESFTADFDDLWNNFIPTPPQSPHIFDYFDELFEAKNLNNIDSEKTVISHDCMWSGQCSQGKCKQMLSQSNSFMRSDALAFNWPKSPRDTLDVAPFYEENLTEYEEIPHEQQTLDGNVYAMANDHSYDSPQRIDSPSVSSTKVKSLIKKEKSHCKKNCKMISQAKISKMKAKKVTNRKSSNSILNTNFNDTKKENSVLKPTIISVASFKNIQNSLQTRYNVSIKKKKHSEDNSIPARTIIQVKNLSSIGSQNNVPISSPTCSDSEESSLSFSSGDDHKTSPPLKRREHNDSERKRRDHLRNSFNNLRDQVPKLKSSQKRPPRIMILHEATNYVKNLIEKNNELEDIYKREMEKRKRLMEILKKSNNGTN